MQMYLGNVNLVYNIGNVNINLPAKVYHLFKKKGKKIVLMLILTIFIVNLMLIDFKKLPYYLF